jgi:hypothetical protein
MVVSYIYEGPRPFKAVSFIAPRGASAQLLVYKAAASWHDSLFALEADQQLLRTDSENPLWAIHYGHSIHWRTSMTMYQTFKNIDPFGFEGDYTNPNTRHHKHNCLMVEYLYSDPSGADCLVVYPSTDGLEPSSVTETLKSEWGVESPGLEQTLAQMGGKWEICLDCKSALEPTCQEGAKRLFRESLISYKPMALDGQDSAFYWGEHVPYCQAQMGRVAANCAPFLLS